MECFEAVKKIDQNYAKVYIYIGIFTQLLFLGDILLKTFRYKEALPILNYAFKLIPNNFELLMVIADYYNLKYEFEMSLKYLYLAKDIQPKDLNCLTLLSTLNFFIRKVNAYQNQEDIKNH